MKLKGTVIKYNQASGIIKDQNNTTYIFTKHNLKNNDNLVENDEVRFTPQKFQTIDTNENIATFIEKAQTKTLKKEL